ncbi:hypothetical protein lerEdw1_005023 [Lerista edwardsae]|nr:hypothetical protein lerEdw1_005023 [Lerista edwardsae]
MPAGRKESRVRGHRSPTTGLTGCCQLLGLPGLLLLHRQNLAVAPLRAAVSVLMPLINCQPPYKTLSSFCHPPQCHPLGSMASGPGQELPADHGDLEGSLWGSWAGQAPLLPHIPGTYPALRCCSCLPPPAHSLLPQQVSALCEVPGGRPLLWPGPLVYSPFLAPPAPAEDPSRAKAAAAAASRESTAALKAWLGRHLKNPYPSKGEKLLLALVSRMSLTQVSTWFANARRRLKKESYGASGWPPSPAAAAPSSARQPPASSASWRKPADGRRASPKIWRVAELAVGGATGAVRAAGLPSGMCRRRRGAPPVPGLGQRAEGTAEKTVSAEARPRCTCAQPEESESRAGGEEA